MFKNGLAYVTLFTAALTYYFTSHYVPWWAAAVIAGILFVGMVEVGEDDASISGY